VEHRIVDGDQFEVTVLDLRKTWNVSPSGEAPQSDGNVRPWPKITAYASLGAALSEAENVLAESKLDGLNLVE